MPDIKLPDGKKIPFKDKIDGFEIAKKISKSLAKEACIMEVDSELKDLKIEMIDRFGLLPDATKNLFALTSLRIFSKKIGIEKINITDDKAEITLNQKSSIESKKIINLIQKQPQKYQLKNLNTLVFNVSMGEDNSRIERVKNLINQLQ